MKFPIKRLLLAGLVCLACPQADGTTHLREWVVSVGGGRIASAGHALQCAIGEPAIGGTCGSAHGLYAGFWRPLGWDCSASGVDIAGGMANGFALAIVTPGTVPTNQVRFAVPRPSRVSIALFDITGRTVETLVDAELSAGWHAVGLHGEGLRSGLYLCRMTAPGFSATRRLVLTK